MSNGSGGSSPGSTTNGGAFGFSIGGGSDSENSYLVEGQETANIIGGYSHTNVPMDFIQEVQMKTSGVEAEYGGALGGVVNVIMQKGTNTWHGSVFTSFQDGAMNGSLTRVRATIPALERHCAGVGSSGSDVPELPACPSAFQRLFSWMRRSADRCSESFRAPQIALRTVFFLFAGFNPEFNAFEERVNYGSDKRRRDAFQPEHTDVLQHCPHRC